MSYQGAMVFTDTIASGTSTSSGVNLTRSWPRIFVCVNTMSTQAQLTVQGSPDGGVTFYNIMKTVPNTATVQVNGVFIATGTSGGMVEIDGGGMPWIRVLASATITNGTSLKIVCQGN